MSIPTYNEAKGRHVSHGSIYATRGVRSVNGTPVYTKSKHKTKKRKPLKPLVWQPGYRKMLGKIPKGYVLKDVLVFSVDPEAYVAVCDGCRSSSEGGKPNLFFRAYTKCKENEKLYYTQSRNVKERREELTELAQEMQVGKLRVGSTPWDVLYAEALRIMTAPPTCERFRVSQVAMMAFSRRETIRRQKDRMKAERMEASESEAD